MQKPDKFIRRLESMKPARKFWEDHWQAVTEFVLTRRADFTDKEEPGAFLNEDVMDDTAVHAAEKAASSLLGMMWPNGSDSFMLEPFNEDILKDDDAKTWLSKATKRVRLAMNDPKAGLATALTEVMLDYVVIGTPSLAVLEDDDLDVAFNAWHVNNTYIDENSDGFVDVIYRKYQRTVRQVVQKFGEENVSAEVKKLFKDEKFDDKVTILHAIEPNSDRDAKIKNNKNLPFLSVYIDVDNKKTMKESGFHEFPAPTPRASKRIGEKYGRSMAMQGLPSIIMANVLSESVTVAIEKNLEPPLMIQGDQILGNETLDTSANAVNVINVTGKLNGSPIQPLFEVNQINDAVALLEATRNNIKDHFMLDRLVDFNNEVRMTASEVFTRERIRNDSLGATFARLEAELFTPMIERVFAILLRAGKLGVPANTPEAEAADDDTLIIPESILALAGKKEPAVRVKYLNPAARSAEAAAAQAILQTWEFAGSIAQVDPEVLDNLDANRSLKEVGRISGAPNEIFREDDKIQAMREERQKQRQQMQQMEMANLAANTAKTANEAGGE